MKMAGTSSLQELLIPTHGDAESVNDLKSKMLGAFQNILVRIIEFLHSILETMHGDDKDCQYMNEYRPDPRTSHGLQWSLPVEGSEYHPQADGNPFLKTSPPP